MGEQSTSVFENYSSELRELEAHRRQFEELRHVTSHDLKSPARLIAMYLQLLAKRHEATLDTEGKEFLAFARAGARRLTRMLEAIDAIVRLKAPSPQARVDLNEAFGRARQLLTPKISQTQATVVCDSLPVIPGQIEPWTKTFHHLLENALTYQNSEPPRIRIGCRREHGMWRIRVEDNGKGIATEDRERALQLFHRLETELNTEGIGLGLAYCRRVVELQGGELAISDSSLGGACLALSIPSA